MKQRKRHHALASVLGVSILAALSLLAITAAGAQAASLFLVEDAFTHELLEVKGSEPIRAQTSGGSLLVAGISILCTTADLKGKLTSKTTGEATLTFLGCKFVEGGSACKLASSEISALVNGELVGEEKGMWMKIVPAEGPAFAKVTIEQIEPEECLLIGAGQKSETLSVTGSEAGLFDPSKTTAIGDLLLLSTSISAAAKKLSLITGLKLVNSPAVIDGEVPEFEVLNAEGVKVGLLKVH